MKPLVSVVIPYFNKSSTILGSVESVLSQTHQNFELILVDDASTIPLTLETSWLNHPIHLIRNPINLGPGPSRQRGMDQARGEFIAFLDADDWWSPEFVEKCLNKLIQEPSAAAAWAQTIVYTKDGNVFQRRYCTRPFNKLRETILQYSRPWQTGSLLWRKSCCGDWGCLSTNQDYYFEYSSSLKSNYVVPVCEPLYHVNQGLGNHRSDLLSNSEVVLNQFDLHDFVFNSIRHSLDCKSRILLFHRILRSLLKVNEECIPSQRTTAWQKSEAMYPFMKLFFRRNEFLEIFHKLLQHTPYRLYF